MWGGTLVAGLSVSGLFLFSLFIFFERSLCLAWFFLELAGLSLIPLFFPVGLSVNMVGLFYYLIVSGISSGLILSGVLFSDCIFFTVLGVLIKFGIFPFVGWVYAVLKNSCWLVIWGFSTFLKRSFIVVSFFLLVGGIWGGFIIFLCSLSCLVIAFLFWIFSIDWKICWCHMMLSSRSVLISLSFSGSSIDSVLIIFIIYFLWRSFVLFFFYSEGLKEMSQTNYFLFIFFYSFLLLTLPLSFSIFYKISVCVSIFSTGLFFLVCWVLYSISEQFYLISFLVRVFSQKGGPSLLVLV